MTRWRADESIIHDLKKKVAVVVDDETNQVLGFVVAHQNQRDLAYRAIDRALDAHTPPDTIIVSGTDRTHRIWQDRTGIRMCQPVAHSTGNHDIERFFLRLHQHLAGAVVPGEKITAIREAITLFIESLPVPTEGGVS